MSINKSFTIMAIALSATLAIITLATSSDPAPTTTTVPPTTTTEVLITSTVVITPPPTTTTTTIAPTTTIDFRPVVDDLIATQATIYPRCAEWLPTLIEVGGKLEDWGTWSRVLWTESRCQPTADNGACVGLTQIYYEVHKKWLTDLGYTRADLYDPVVNLRFAVMLQDSSGWSPWAYLNMP